MTGKLIAIILTVILIGSFAVFARSADITIDGRTNEREWVDSYAVTLVSTKDISNCDVEFAAVSSVIDYDNNVIYFAFRVIVDGTVDLTTMHGVSVDINNSGAVRIDHSGVTAYDTVYYSYNAAVCEYSSNSFCVEAAVGIKYGIDSVHDISIQFVDGDGDYSNVYRFDLPEPPTEEITTVSYDEETEYTEEDYTESKTTKPTTTKKVTTTKATTEKKTTLPRTTYRKTTASEITEHISVKESESFVQTKPATTHSQKNTTIKIVTVYVPVTDNGNKTESENSTVYPAVSQIPGSEENAETSESDTFKIRKESAYLSVAVLAIVTFGVCVIVNMSYDKQKKSE